MLAVLDLVLISAFWSLGCRVLYGFGFGAFGSGFKGAWLGLKVSRKFKV